MVGVFVYPVNTLNLTLEGSTRIGFVSHGFLIFVWNMQIWIWSQRLIIAWVKWAGRFESGWRSAVGACAACRLLPAARLPTCILVPTPITSASLAICLIQIVKTPNASDSFAIIELRPTVPVASCDSLYGKILKLKYILPNVIQIRLANTV